MNIEDFYNYCLEKPFVEETFPFGEDTLVLNAGIRYDSFEADPSSDEGFNTERKKNSNDSLEWFVLPRRVKVLHLLK